MKNNKRPKRGVREIIVRGVKALLEKLGKKEEGGPETREKIIIGKGEIMSILPHRGKFLLLDRVVITPEKIIGEFKVPREVCHEVWGKAIFRGVDYPEMAAQVLGIWIAQQAKRYPVFNEKIAPLRKASFMSIAPSFPEDLLRIEMPIIEGSEEKGEEASPRIERVGREDRLGQIRYQAIGLNIGVWAGEIKRAVIYFVELSIRDAQSLAE